MTALKRAIGGTAALAGLIWLGTVIAPLERLGGVLPEPTLPSKPATTATQKATATVIRNELAKARVVEQRPDRHGYDRGCNRGQGCVFGRAWTDDHNGPLGRNGCDTRNDVLRRQLTRVTTKAGTHGCIVLAGRLHDPYTGTLIEFRKKDAREIQVDHVFSLARAWDLGGSTWTQDRRIDFANDPANLVATAAQANASKADQGPGEWLPVNRGYRCAYVLRYLAVANRYDLAITRGDHIAARMVAATCPDRPARR